MQDFVDLAVPCYARDMHTYAFTSDTTDLYEYLDQLAMLQVCAVEHVTLLSFLTAADQLLLIRLASTLVMENDAVQPPLSSHQMLVSKLMLSL